MVIKASAPCRVSLCGGGSDLPEFTGKEGSTLSFSINLRTSVTLYTGDDVVSYPYNTFAQNTSPELCYKILDYYGLNGFHTSALKTYSDAQIGAGLGTSGAFSVALVAACEKARGKELDLNDIAERAFELESSIGKTGRQDHFAASFGGGNVFLYYKDNPTTQVAIHEKLTSFIYPYMVLFNIGTGRDSYKKQSGKKIIPRRLADITIKGFEALCDKDIKNFSNYMNESWEIKKKMTEVDEKVLRAIEVGLINGALTGKLLGAGGDGHLLFLVHPERREKFIKKMKELDLSHIDFMIDKMGVSVRRIG